MRKVSAMAFAVLVSACGAGAAPHAQCAASGVGVNVETLPARWIEHGRFTLCQGNICSTQTSPFTHFYGRGPFVVRSTDDRTPVVVTLRLEVGGVEVLHARTSGKARPSPTARGEVSETCGGRITLRLDKEPARPNENRWRLAGSA
jgi:hypothetical protein